MRSILFRSAMLLVCLLIAGVTHADGSDLSNTRQGLYYGKKAAPVLGTAVEVRVMPPDIEWSIQQLVIVR
jgi:hypothetical protein